MKRLFFLLAFGLAACLPQVAPPAGGPLIQASATAYIDPSYPTSQAALAAPNQSASGVEVKMDRAWQDGKNVNANVCFTMPDSADWSIWNASLNYGGTVLQEYGTTLVNIQPPAGGGAGLRCDTLTFVVPPDANLSAATITIDSIGAAPRTDEYCSMYLPKIQQVLSQRGIGITLDCVDLNGAATMQITSKPPEMSQEQAEQIVFSDEFYTIKGPWTFSFSLGQ